MCNCNYNLNEVVDPNGAISTSTVSTVNEMRNLGEKTIIY